MNQESRSTIDIDIEHVSPHTFSDGIWYMLLFVYEHDLLNIHTW